jgi:hypothetical protein
MIMDMMMMMVMMKATRISITSLYILLNNMRD